jgi:hypothetical protein
MKILEPGYFHAVVISKFIIELIKQNMDIRRMTEEEYDGKLTKMRKD